MTDTESVKKVFEKACKLGLTQVSGIQIDDPVDSVDQGPKGDGGASKCLGCVII